MSESTKRAQGEEQKEERGGTDDGAGVHFGILQCSAERRL